MEQRKQTEKAFGEGFPEEVTGGYVDDKRWEPWEGWGKILYSTAARALRQGLLWHSYKD